MLSSLFEYEDDNFKLINEVDVNTLKDLELAYVCRVRNSSLGCITQDEKARSSWYYDDIDRSVLYNSHRSWVYVITVDKRIKKIGECGVPLGIQKKGSSQPLKSTNNRLGRYSYLYEKNDTDTVIRSSLYDDIKEDRVVEFYAYKCPIIETEVTLGGTTYKLQSCIHKDLEKVFLDHFKKLTGNFPDLNVARC